jgi:5,10-methylenetetrahydrofolate reductase
VKENSDIRRFRDRLKLSPTGGELVFSVEILPPHGTNFDKMLDSARLFAPHVCALNIPSNPMSKLKMSSIAAAHIIQDGVGVEAIPHITCRDSNVLGLQSELLGAGALGLQNLLIITGDQPQVGDHPHVQPVFEISSLELIRLARRLNNDEDAVGQKLNGNTDFFIGVGANPLAQNMDAELERLSRKKESGAGFVQTQPVFETDRVIKFLEKAQPIGIPIMISIMFLNDKVVNYFASRKSGIHIPESVAKRITQDGADGMLETAKEIVHALKGYASGFHLMPIAQQELALKFLDKIV